MSLATRCPACGTVFRVVRDQLKVSEGWVRCGRCSEVFNAGQRLFDLEQDRKAEAATPARTPGTTPPRTASAPAAPPPAARSGLAPLSPATARVGSAWAPPSRPAVLWAPESEAQPLTDSAAPAHPAGAAQGEPRAEVPAPTPAEAGKDLPAYLAEPAPDSATPPSQPALQGGSGTQPEGAAAADSTLEWHEQPQERPQALPDAPTEPPRSQEEGQAAGQAVAEPEPTPGFVLQADRAARWRHPARRGTLALMALTLVALLAAQLALHFRDGLAAEWPASRPWLQAACNALGCRIEAPRRIDSLSVDSSGLVRVEGSRQYRLSMVVHNRASTAVRMPAIDLALTDTQGQTLARRVLTMAELGQSAQSLPPRGELALQAMLELGEQRVAGYTVELFYP